MRPQRFCFWGSQTFRKFFFVHFNIELRNKENFQLYALVIANHFIVCWAERWSVIHILYTTQDTTKKIHWKNVVQVLVRTEFVLLTKIRTFSWPRYCEVWYWIDDERHLIKTTNSNKNTVFFIIVSQIDWKNILKSVIVEYVTQKQFYKKTHLLWRIHN